MKFTCLCGEAIVVADEAAPNRGWLIADQDVADGAEGETQRRPVCQCLSCGRICFADPVSGEMLWFRPERPVERSSLGSLLGNAYPVTLTGGWQAWQTPPRGDLFWGTSGDRAGGFETYTDWEALRRRYFVILEQLRAEGRLKAAWLHRGEETVHAWPQAGTQCR